MDNDVIFPRLIAALGIRPIRVPDLGEPYRLFLRSRLALIDADATREDWDGLYGAVLAAMPRIEG